MYLFHRLFSCSVILDTFILMWNVFKCLESLQISGQMADSSHTSHVFVLRCGRPWFPGYFAVCLWMMKICVCEGGGVKRESVNYISISGVMLGISGPWGHLTSLFINLLPDWKDSCCSLSPPQTRSLSHFSLLFFRSFAAFPPALDWTLDDVNEKPSPLWFSPPALVMIKVQQGGGIWDIIPRLTERQVNDGEDWNRVKRSVNEYKDDNPILKILIKMNLPLFSVL